MTDNAQETLAPTSFASRVRGTDAHVIDVTLARLAADVYSDTSSGVDGWRPLNEQELASANIGKEMLANARSGFAARIYADDHGNYVLAFRGTDQGKDWTHNLRQGLGFEDAQYEAANRLAQKASNAFGDNLVITGHSLGGGLASLGAVTTGTPAVTFNSAGLNDATLQRLHRDPDAVHQAAAEGQIRRYAVDHEILTTLQEKNLLTRGLMPDAVGHKIELPDPEPLSGWKHLIPGSSLQHGLHLHGMESVLESQQLAAHGSMADPAHPANGMFNEALSGLKGIKADALGFSDDEQYRNAAGSLVAKSHDAGMRHIDHVVVGANNSLFAVEGPLEDASHRIVSVDKTQAAAQSLDASSKQVGESPSETNPIAAQTMDVQRRAAPMH